MVPLQCLDQLASELELEISRGTAAQITSVESKVRPGQVELRKGPAGSGTAAQTASFELLVLPARQLE